MGKKKSLRDLRAALPRFAPDPGAPADDRDCCCRVRTQRRDHPMVATTRSSRPPLAATTQVRGGVDLHTNRGHTSQSYPALAAALRMARPSDSTKPTADSRNSCVYARIVDMKHTPSDRRKPAG